MNRPNLTTTATYTLLASAAVASFMLPSSLPTARASGVSTALPATFHVTGPVVEGGSPYGNAILDSVEFPTGETFDHFIAAKSITGFAFSGTPGGYMRIITGHESTVGPPGVFDLEDEDGDSSSISSADIDAFNARILSAYENENLNSYIDLSCDCPFTYVIEFSELVRDNDSGDDNFGELLYFERGAGAGNSWIMLTAVDADGSAIGPAVAVGPDDTQPTSPPAHVGRYDAGGGPSGGTQEMGATTIDLSRLGVTELRYLRISNPIPGVGGYTSGERYPDGKVFAVSTSPRLPDPLTMFD